MQKFLLKVNGVPLAGDANLIGNVIKDGLDITIGEGGGGSGVSSVNGETGAVVLTTADILDSTNKRYVTDSQQTILSNTSGTNTGDNATNSQYSGLASSKQDTLFSGTNLKTINGNSLLGSGDLVIAGVQSGQVDINFGTIDQEDSYTVTTVLTSSVLTTSIITVSPSGVATADHDPDDYQWDLISGYVTNIVNGVSFDIIGVAPNGSWGTYKINYLIN